MTFPRGREDGNIFEVLAGGGDSDRGGSGDGEGAEDSFSPSGSF